MFYRMPGKRVSRFLLSGTVEARLQLLTWCAILVKTRGGREKSHACDLLE